VLTAYGATEFPGGLVGWTLPDYEQFHEAKRGSAGRARPGIKIRVVDPETGAELPRGREGLISVNSPQATIRTEDGWVRTTDYARMDEDGFVWILGRADDAINRGGFTIVPQVIEAALQRHPAVAEAAVVGVPDERLWQVPVAAVQLSSPATPEELIEWCRENLVRYQVPVRIRVVDDLPRTTSLKVAKDGVRAVFGVVR
jgi:acyl-coenzyme A synthetase/AMP-(fatty) acid ligase